MLVIGLTGSIGMGKSTAARAFAAKGIPVFDADAVVHQLYEGKAVPLIEEAFPGTTQNGKVDRQRLAEAVVSDAQKLQRLEDIVHPLVRDARMAFLNQHARSGTPMVVLEIPLLFETGSETEVDVTVLVTAPAEVQRDRVMERPGMTREKFEKLLANQMPDAEKRQKADYVVDTNQPVSQTAQEIDKVIESLRERPGKVTSRLTD